MSVGSIETVSESYLKALEPVKMARTDPSLKPKPGFVARQQPTKVRGVSISGGQGQNARAFFQQQQAAASSSSSTAPARPLPAAKSSEVWARAVEDFTGSDARELAFQKGAVLRILSQDDSGWWSAELSGKLGFAPSTYLELCAAPAPHDRRPSMHNAPLPAKKW